jgi:hypothetical protein
MDVKMKRWVPEGKLSQQEVDTMIAGAAKELQKVDSDASVVYVSADTLIYATMDPDGNGVIYECTIRRSNTDDMQLPPGSVSAYPTPTGKPS